MILDLDGTIYRGSAVVPGAPEFVRRLRSAGVPYIFLTNRSNRKPLDVVKKLNGLGIACDLEQVLTSSIATARYLTGVRDGEPRVFVVGEDGLTAALQAAGIEITDDRPDFVVLGLDRRLTYATLEKAVQLIRAGANFIATNPDLMVNTDKGISPGVGAIAAAVSAAAGVAPMFIGKPDRRMLDIALERLGVGAADVIMVGDNVASDVVAGAIAGLRTVLILTGVSTREDLAQADCKPTWVVENFAELTQLVFGPGDAG